jgi:hypothetical protein
MVNRAVDMCLGGEVDDDIRFRYQRFYNLTLTDVAFDESIAGTVLHFPDVLQVPGVGKLVKIGHTPVRVGSRNIVNKVAPDESCPTRH